MTHRTKTHAVSAEGRGSISSGRMLYSRDEVLELRNRHARGKLSTEESRRLLLLGNEEHVAALRDAKANPRNRHEAIVAGNANYLVVACSDARVLRMDTENDILVGMQIRVAGNAIPKPGTASFTEIQQAVARVKEGGLVLVEGHCNCGAVKERVNWVQGGMKSTGSDDLDGLLKEVCGGSPEENVAGQLAKARQTLGLGNRQSAAFIYDWESVDGVRLLPGDTEAAPMAQLLMARWRRAHFLSAAEENGLLAERLKQQKPHAILVGTPDLPFSLATLLHAKQNEVFSTTGSEDGLDYMDKASILYAVEHLGVRHIAFVAPGSASEPQRLHDLFAQWEKDIRGMSRALEARIVLGEIKTSWFRYDLKTGRLEAVI